MSIDPISGVIEGAVGSVSSAVKSVEGTLGGLTKPMNVSDPTALTRLNDRLLWPIKAKGGIADLRKKFTPLGDPKIQAKWHNSLEQGRLLEKSIGDAQFQLEQKKKDLLEKIQHKFDTVNLAIDGKLSDRPRAIKYGIDAANFLRSINAYQSEIMGLISAAVRNIAILNQMETEMVQMVQSNLNAIAGLMHEICNWGLPDFPSLPNYFGDTIWRWNGFNFFPLQSFIPKIGFDFNFSFNQCVIHVPNIDIFRNYPSSITDGQGLVYGQPPFIPPLGGHIPTANQLNDPNFVTFLKDTNTTTGPYTATTDPFYHPATNAKSMMWGSIPNPVTIISNYKMPAATFRDNIISILDTTRDQVIETTDADYENPNLTTRQANLRSSLEHKVTLENVVASNYEPILTSAWLFYMDSCRTGRGGYWIPNFEYTYDLFLQPSINKLTTEPVPWNNVVDGPGVTAGPQGTLFGEGMKAMDERTAAMALWKLSYLEAAILGYNRNTKWDANADLSYIADYTGSDLDYKPTTLDLANTTSYLLGADEAEFPVKATYPVAIAGVLDKVIAIAHKRIQSTPKWRSRRADLRFIYNIFAEAREVDRFSQFWREFNSNLQAVLLQDPYVIQFVASYPEALDSAIDPLGDPAIYEAIQLDAESRNRTWTPGTPLLPIPKAPVVTTSTTTGYVCIKDNTGRIPTETGYWRIISPDEDEAQFTWKGTWASDSSYVVNNAVYYTPSGWSQNPNYPNAMKLDPVAFLSRPDVQAQSIPVQMAMLNTNLNYASLMVHKELVREAIQEQIDSANRLMNDFETIGFKVESGSSENIPVGPTGVTVSFNILDFDLTGNVKSPTQFVVQAAGNYAIIAQLNWGAGGTGVRTGTILKGTEAIATSSTDVNDAGPQTQIVSTSYYFNVGDTLTVVASHNLPTAQSLEAGCLFSITKVSDSAPDTTVPPPPPTDTTTKNFTAGATFSALTAVRTTNDGTVIPIDPTTVEKNGEQTVYPYPDGIALGAATPGIVVPVATNYGDIYTVPDASFAVGSLLYVGADGTLTQDFSALMSSVQWVICVGRAASANSFIYEPHIPTRTVLSY